MSRSCPLKGPDVFIEHAAFISSIEERRGQRKMAQKALIKMRSEPFVLKKLVRLAGIEPTTPWFVAKYSIQLSYSRPRPALYADFAIWQSPDLQ
jgi:hypothetical protein